LFSCLCGYGFGVGFDDEQIFVNDPAFADRPIAINPVAFELAWLGFDYLSAVITPISE
jgi:hypothetical protein